EDGYVTTAPVHGQAIVAESDGRDGWDLRHVCQPVQRQVRRPSNLLQDEVAVRLEHRLAMPAHLARRYRAGRTMTLRPFHSRGDGNTEPRRNLSNSGCGGIVPPRASRGVRRSIGEYGATVNETGSGKPDH